jgi:hypothetical protein
MLKEWHGTRRAYRQVADLVDYQERGVGERLESLRQPTPCLRLLQGADQVRERPVVDPSAVLGRRDGQADGEVRLAYCPTPPLLSRVRRPEEDHVLLPLHEAELMLHGHAAIHSAGGPTWRTTLHAQVGTNRITAWPHGSTGCLGSG